MALDRGNNRRLIDWRRVLRRIGRFAALCFLASQALGPPAIANQVRSLNLEELAARADRIFSGRVVAVRLRYDRDIGQFVTATTLRVDRGLKGDLPGQITIKTLGYGSGGSQAARGSGGEVRAVRGMPQFHPGEKVILFLYGDSRLGLTSPVGFGQGKFSVIDDEKNGPLVVNGFGNRHLTRGLSDQASRRIGAKTARWPETGPVPTAEFLEIVTELVGDVRRGSP